MANGVSVAIPTYRRESILVDTIRGLRALAVPPDEIIVVDQSPTHEAATESYLRDANEKGIVRWIRLNTPSIPHAMNIGLLDARQPLVLFVDDDIVPHADLIVAHREAHSQPGRMLVAGRVFQPWDNRDGPLSGFASAEPGFVDEFIGCNFSVKRDAALSLGGFDERFVRVAYRFEAEFSARVRRVGGAIWFEPAAAVDHLKSAAGGTRSFGDHLRTFLPSHAVGDYYFNFRARPRGWFRAAMRRPFKSVATRHHLRRPWWIVPTLLSELTGIIWAMALWVRGPALLDRTSEAAVRANPFARWPKD